MHGESTAYGDVREITKRPTLADVAREKTAIDTSTHELTQALDTIHEMINQLTDILLPVLGQNDRKAVKDQSPKPALGSSPLYFRINEQVGIAQRAADRIRDLKYGAEV